MKFMILGLNKRREAMNKAEKAYEKMFELREEKTFEEYKKRGIEILESYASEERKEAAVKFAKWIKNQSIIYDRYEGAGNLYDTWLKQKEGSNETKI